ncbi:hypothetical protein COCON_G00174780 [Conger conger]|uniref:Syntaphilin n=1 Tax=Conger conger TaxID=82655 RepID=A0A9Q1D4G6_CONCO|nr:hypothetical protein COCON_G00174780 [Conger conger]
MSAPVSQKASTASQSFDYCRFIELDCVPMETGFMVSMRPSHGHMPHQSPERHRRRTAPSCSSRDPYGSASVCSSTSGSCRGSDCSPTARSYPTTPRRTVKYTSCNDNHGIRPPPPEQYLTPLQQKEVCIRHLRARLKENMETLQDRDSEIEDLRTQLSRMQEDWIEEECHRVEAQLALKEAQREIQQLKQVVDVLHLHQAEPRGAAGPGRGPGARPERGGDPGQRLRLRGQPGRPAAGHAAVRGPASPYALPRSFTYDKLCTCDLLLEELEAGSSSQPCLSRAHLYLQHLRECAAQTEHALRPPGLAHPRSPSCSPSSTWISEEGEGPDTVAAETVAVDGVTVGDPDWPPPPPTPPPSGAVELPPTVQTCQPTGAGPLEEHCRVSVEVEEEEEEGEDDTEVQDGAGAGAGAEGGQDEAPLQKSYWSRHFLMDLLAVAVPVVPAVAWLCRGPRRPGEPVYNMGSLLRGCCALTLHSLRRGGVARCSPVSARGGTEI